MLVPGTVYTPPPKPRKTGPQEIAKALLSGILMNHHHPLRRPAISWNGGIGGVGPLDFHEKMKKQRSLGVREKEKNKF